MKLSVIIPFWKYKIFLDDCLGSLVLSDYKKFETILVLDQVEEEIDDLIEKYSELLDLKVIESPKHGVAAARNAGLKAATGDYVYFLDSDDYVLADTFARLAFGMQKHEGYDVYAGTNLITWYKRVNYLSVDNTETQEEALKIYAEAKKKFRSSFGTPENENQITAIADFLLSEKHFFDLTVLGRAYSKSFLEENQIVFDEELTYYCDQPFVMAVLSGRPSMTECKKAYYMKRKHTDPFNYPELLKVEDDDQFIANQGLSYKKAMENTDGEVLQTALAFTLAEYAAPLGKHVRRSLDKKWEEIVYTTLQPYYEDIPEEAIKALDSYSKKCAIALKNNDKKVLKKRVGRQMTIDRVKKMSEKRNMNELYKALYIHRYSKMPIKKNVIMFESFFGKSYSDSPKYIYEYLAKHYPDKYEFVWVLNNDTVPPYGAKIVKRFSAEYAKYLAISKYFVFNVRQPLWFRKRKGQVFLETWHGTPLKKLVFDQEEVMAASPKYKIQFHQQKQAWDYLVSANRFSTEVFKSCFMFDKEMLDMGYPRNDLLYAEDKDEIALKIKTQLGIPLDKKTILYAPTWRDNESYGSGQYKFTLALDLKRLQEEFSDEYVVLLRTHYFIADKIDVTGMEDFVFNLSDYNDITELYLISDICITDYSSVFFDYGNLKRPELFFVYDYENYRDNLRGFYISMEEDVPGPLLYTNDDVVEAIKNIDQITEQYKDRFDVFYDRFCTYDDGHASERICRRVFGEPTVE